MSRQKAVPNEVIDDDIFKEPLKTFGHFDLVWGTALVKKWSDLSERELAGTLQHDDQSVATLVSAETRIPLHMQLPSELQVKAVCAEVLETMKKTRGGVLHDLKHRGGLKSDGAIAEAALRYSVSYSARGLKRGRHTSGRSRIAPLRMSKFWTTPALIALIASETTLVTGWHLLLNQATHLRRSTCFRQTHWVA